MKKKAALTIIGWMISAAILFSLFTHMDFHAIWEGLRNANWGWLVFAGVINFAVMAVKAFRWQIIMGRLVSFATIFRAAFISAAGNNVLPARGGDWLRIYLLGKWAGTSKASLASVTGLDKLFDGIAILILFGLFSFHSFGLGKTGQAFPEWVRHGTVVVSLVIAFSLAACIGLLFHHKRTGDTKELGRIGRFVKNMGAGMDMLSDKKLVAGATLTSLISTFIQIVTIWACQTAFGVHFDLWIAAIVFIAINLAITIPSAPSGVGPFEAAAVLTYAWLGLKTETAFNIALMYHAVQFFPVTILGFLFYFKSHCERSDAIPNNSTT